MMTLQAVPAWASDQNPRLPNWIKSLLLHHQRQKNLVSGTEGGLCQKKKKKKIDENDSRDSHEWVMVENSEWSKTCQLSSCTIPNILYYFYLEWGLGDLHGYLAFDFQWDS